MCLAVLLPDRLVLVAVLDKAQVVYCLSHLVGVVRGDHDDDVVGAGFAPLRPRPTG